MTPQSSRRLLTRATWVIAATLALVLSAYAAAGYWLAPRLLRDTLTDFVDQRLGHTLALGKVRADPWRLTVTIDGGQLASRDGTVLASFEKIALVLDPASLWSRAWRVREIHFSVPHIVVSRAGGGTHNWAALLAALPRNDGSAPPRLHVGLARIERGDIAYGEGASPGELTLRARQIDLRLDNWSTYADADAPYALSAALPDGARLEVKGALRWPADRASGEFRLEKFSATTLSRLLALPVDATDGTVTASGRFSIRGETNSLLVERIEVATENLALALPGGTATAARVSLSDGRYAATDGSAGFERGALEEATIARTGAAAPALKLAALSLEKLAVSFPQRTVAIEKVLLSGLDGYDEMDARGASGLAAILSQPAAASPVAAQDSPPAWRLALDKFEANDSAWRLKQGVAVTQAAFIRIDADALQLAPAAAGGVAAARFGASGGSLHFAPGGVAERAVDLREIEFEATQPRFPQGDSFKVRTAFTLQPSGKVRADGEVEPSTLAGSFAVHAEGLPLSAVQPWLDPELALRIGAGTLGAEGRLRVAAKAVPAAADFEGSITVLALQVAEGASGRPLFGAASVRARSVKLALAPASLAVGELELLSPSGRIAIGQDGTLNLGLLRGTPVKKTASASSAVRRPFAVRKILVRDGRLDFADRSITPALALHIDELAGTVTGLDASRPVAAAVALGGRVGEYGSAKFHGTINPFEPSADTDLTLRLRNVDMASLDPYSRRFAGYRIESGKLSGEMRYRVRAGKLEGENQLVMDKLRLGERVASPQAVDLPLEMAIALLTDADGRIALAIPVRGDLGNPEFDLGKIMSQAIGNVIGKIVTAPFRLLAGLFGGGGGGDAAIDQIYFDPGSAALEPSEREKIAAVAQALAARPQLGLRVTGQFDGKIDAEGMRAARMPVDPAALVALARSRAETIRHALVAQGTGPDRIVLAEPASASGDMNEGVPAGLSLSAR